ncbi:hypothetical protein [Micromonospora sp. CPCC 205561]|uniref:hypothetical protein n=1 Tax=Micromonospora sp. CPCC 205561 TaxID=3122407 RepID=UPI002FF1D00A
MLTAFQRALTRALTVLGLVGAFVLTTVAPAWAGENTFVEVVPNSAQNGTRVNIRAGCDDANNRQASVRSDAFGGPVVLRPDNGFLTGQVTIPGSKEPGDYPVDLRCDNGRTATTTLTVLNMERPSKGPATGGGGTVGASGTGSMLMVGGLAVVALAVGFGFFGNRRRTGTGS